MSERRALILGFAIFGLVTLVVSVGLRLLGASGQLFGFVAVLLVCVGALSMSKVTVHYYPGKRD